MGLEAVIDALKTAHLDVCRNAEALFDKIRDPQKTFGKAIENEVRRLIYSQPGVTCFDESNSIFVGISTSANNHELRFSLPNKDLVLVYNLYSSELFLAMRNLRSLQEIDVLFECEGKIVCGEVRFLNGAKRRNNARRQTSPFDRNEYISRIRQLSRFFDTPVSYWVIANSDYLDRLNVFKNPPCYISAFLEEGRRAVPIKINHYARKQFFDLIEKYSSSRSLNKSG